MVEQVKTKTEPYVRFRGFDDEWEQVTLGDVAKLKNGYSFKSDLYTDNGSYKILTIGNITGDTYIDTTNTKTISKLPENIQEHQILSVGDILISMTGNVGRVSMVDVDGTLLNQRVGLIDVSDTVDRTFVYQVLSSSLFEANMVDRGQGAAQMNIGKSDIESYRIYTPSLDEQQKIGNLFQTLDKTIDLSNTQVENLKQQKKALLQRLFPQKGETEPKVRLRGFTDEWEEVKLGDVAKLKNGYSFKSDLYTDNGSYKILTIGNVTGDTYIDTTNTKTISKLPENIQGHQILSVGDILISMTGNVGRVSMVDVDDTLLNQRVGLIDISDTVDRTFMYQVLSSPLFEANMVDKGQGAAQMNIGKSDIESYSMYIPSLEEQQAIGELFQMVDEQTRLAEDKVSQYKELKQALLQRLFV